MTRRWALGAAGVLAVAMLATVVVTQVGTEAPDEIEVAAPPSAPNDAPATLADFSAAPLATERMTRYLGDVDLSRSVFSISVRAERWAEVADLYLELSFAGTFAQRASAHLLPAMQSRNDGEWQRYVLSRSDFTSESHPDWTKVNGIRLVPNASRAAELRVGRVIATRSRTDPVVSVVFDDGYRSVATVAAPILAEHGMHGAAYVIADTGPPNFLTTTEIASLAESGWEIGGHTDPPLAEVSPAAAADEIARADAWARRWQTTVDRRPGFAYALGSHDTHVRSLAQQRFLYARGTSPLGQTADVFDRWNLNTRQVGATTTLEQVRRWIDQAILYHEWLIIAFHRVDGVAGLAEDVDADLLRGIVDYLASSGASVELPAEVVGDSS